jgi:hypothetical protein
MPKMKAIARTGIAPSTKRNVLGARVALAAVVETVSVLVEGEAPLRFTVVGLREHVGRSLTTRPVITTHVRLTFPVNPF